MFDLDNNHKHFSQTSTAAISWPDAGPLSLVASINIIGNYHPRERSSSRNVEWENCTSAFFIEGKFMNFVNELKVCFNQILFGDNGWGGDIKHLNFHV